jgi:uncharacterized membrane protein YphA (DoxX/SURF4 family)
MKSIDIKSLLIGALFTAVVFLSTGWQQVSGIQKVEIVQPFSSRPLKVSLDGEVKVKSSTFDPIWVKIAP